MEHPHKTTVLLVDDEQDLLDLLRDFLEVAGFGVQVALDGAEALRILAATTVNCVLLDVMLLSALKSSSQPGTGKKIYDT